MGATECTPALGRLPAAGWNKLHKLHNRSLVQLRALKVVGRVAGDGEEQYPGQELSQADQAESSGRRLRWIGVVADLPVHDIHCNGAATVQPARANDQVSWTLPI